MTGKKGRRKPAKPYPEYPLGAASNGQWRKKINGRTHYFGPWAAPDEALRRYLNERDGLAAGQVSTRTDTRDKTLTVRDMVNAFLTSRKRLVESGELTQRSWNEYKQSGSNLANHLGPARDVTSLAPVDFDLLRSNLAKKKRSPLTLGTEIQRCRTIFKYAFDADLIDAPVRFGNSFQKPGKKAIRLHKAKQGELLFTREEINTLIASASRYLRAMIYLGINCGFGQNDVATIKHGAVADGWIDHPRPKTGIPRMCPLWPSTAAALQHVIDHPRPAGCDAAAGLLFVTQRGFPFVRDRVKPDGGLTHIDSISLLFGKLLRAEQVKKPGIGFYTLRRTFRTVADAAGDKPAVDAIMGHTADSSDMGAVYRQRIEPERLEAVTGHVRAWLDS